MTDNWMPDESRWPSMSIAHLEEARLALNEECQGIQTQLGDKDRTSPEGRRLSVSEHNAWRQKAKWALIKKREVYSRLALYLKQRHNLSNKREESSRLLRSALVTREVTAADIMGMSVPDRRALMDKCAKAADLLVQAAKEEGDDLDE